MANSAQAKKRARQAVKRRDHNRAHRSEMRTYIKRVKTAISNGELEPAKVSYGQMVVKVDQLVSKGLVHANCAARYKSRLNAKLKQLATAA